MRIVCVAWAMRVVYVVYVMRIVRESHFHARKMFFEFASHFHARGNIAN